MASDIDDLLNSVDDLDAEPDELDEPEDLEASDDDLSELDDDYQEPEDDQGDYKDTGGDYQDDYVDAAIDSDFVAKLDDLIKIQKANLAVNQEILKVLKAQPGVRRKQRTEGDASDFNFVPNEGKPKARKRSQPGRPTQRRQAKGSGRLR